MYCQLRLNEVGPISHDSFKALVPSAALPLGDEMKHVLALRGKSSVFAGIARQHHLKLSKDWQRSDGVLDLKQPSVKTLVGVKLLLLLLFLI